MTPTRYSRGNQVELCRDNSATPPDDRTARGSANARASPHLRGFIAAIEYFFFSELDARLNLVAVDYLMYPTEVVGDIWAEYPVVEVLAAVAYYQTAFELFRARRYN